VLLNLENVIEITVFIVPPNVHGATKKFPRTSWLLGRPETGDGCWLVNIVIIMMLTVSWGTFWMMSMPARASISRWVILPQSSLRRTGMLKRLLPRRSSFWTL